MKIYTKTGDRGSSCLYSGERRPKDDAVFAALGDVDEVNSTLGLAREHAKQLDAGLALQVGAVACVHMRVYERSCRAGGKQTRQMRLAACPPLPPSPSLPRHLPPPRPLQLETIQSRLLDVGSAVATPRPSSSDAKLQRTAFSEAHAAQLEEWIDAMTEQLPPLTQFILPSGG